MDGAPGATEPYESLLDRMCQAFKCLPTEAMREIEQAPIGLIHTMLDLRAYGQAHAVYVKSDPGKLPDDPVIDLVLEIDTEIQHEEKQKR